VEIDKVRKKIILYRYRSIWVAELKKRKSCYVYDSTITYCGKSSKNSTGKKHKRERAHIRIRPVVRPAYLPLLGESSIPTTAENGVCVSVWTWIRRGAWKRIAGKVGRFVLTFHIKTMLTMARAGSEWNVFLNSNKSGGARGVPRVWATTINRG